MTDIVRHLGDLEYTYWIMDLASSTHFTVFADMEGCCHTEEELGRALGHVASCHSLLNVRIASDEKGKMAFFPSGQPVPVRLIHLGQEDSGTAETDDGIEKHLDDEQSLPLDWERGPLFRARILQATGGRETLMLTFHHAIADGRSAMNILYEVLSSLNGDDLNVGENDAGEPQEWHIVPGYKGFSGFRGLMGRSLAQGLNRLFFRPSNVPVNGLNWPDHRVDHFLCQRLDADETSRLMIQASKTSAGVHGALCCAQLLSLLDEYPSRTSLRAWLLSLVDLRSRVTPPVSDSDLKLMMSMVESCQEVRRGTGFWELAGIISSRVKHALAKGEHFRMLPTQARLIRTTQGAARKGARTSRMLLRLGQLSRPLVIPVSNIGVADYPPCFRHFAVNSMAFVVPLSSSGIWGSAANTFNGRLNWNFSYATPTVTKEQALRMARRSLDILRNNLDPDQAVTL